MRGQARWMDGRKVGQARRYAILRRDGFCCVYCGGRASPDRALEVDHILAASHGGGNQAGNLVSACWDCNRGKSAGGVVGHAFEHAERKAHEANEARLLGWRSSHYEFSQQEYDGDFAFLSQVLPDPLDVTEDEWASALESWRGPPMVSARLKRDRPEALGN